MLPLSLADELTVTEAQTLDVIVDAEIELSEGLDAGGMNLSLVAALAMAEACDGPIRGAEIRIAKRIPVAGRARRRQRRRRRDAARAERPVGVRPRSRHAGVDRRADRFRRAGDARGRRGDDAGAGRAHRSRPSALTTWWVVKPFGFPTRSPDAYRWWDEDGATVGPDPGALVRGGGDRERRSAGARAVQRSGGAGLPEASGDRGGERRVPGCGGARRDHERQRPDGRRAGEPHRATPTGWRRRFRAPSSCRGRRRDNHRAVRGRLTARRGPLEPEMEVRFLPPEQDRAASGRSSRWNRSHRRTAPRSRSIDPARDRRSSWSVVVPLTGRRSRDSLPLLATELHRVQLRPARPRSQR